MAWNYLAQLPAETWVIWHFENPFVVPAFVRSTLEGEPLSKKTPNRKLEQLQTGKSIIVKVQVKVNML